MKVIDDLLSLVPPPVAPVAGDGDWDFVETELGIRLPEDYKILVARYGVGLFDDTTLLSPFNTHPHGVMNLLKHAHDMLDTHQSLREAWAEEISLAIYPEPGGLLTWAVTGNDDSLCWITEGEPAQWPVLVSSRDCDLERYDMGAAELLYKYFSGQLEIPLLGESPPVPWFDAYREKTHVYVGLSDGELPFEQRLQILRDALHPTADRGFHDDGPGHRQYHFKATDRDWNLTYEDATGHKIRVAFPPEHNDEARTVILGAAQAMGCEVLSKLTIHGTADWSRD